jgi:hypothetical protein
LTTISSDQTGDAVAHDRGYCMTEPVNQTGITGRKTTKERDGGVA